MSILLMKNGTQNMHDPEQVVLKLSEEVKVH
jgi:hypothetical protein